MDLSHSWRSPWEAAHMSSRACCTRTHTSAPSSLSHKGTNLPPGELCGQCPISTVMGRMAAMVMDLLCLFPHWSLVASHTTPPLELEPMLHHLHLGTLDSRRREIEECGHDYSWVVFAVASCGRLLHSGVFKQKPGGQCSKEEGGVA